MEILDLTPDYVKFLSGEIRFEGYRSTHLLFFEHYFTFWGNEGEFIPTLALAGVKSRQERMFRELAAADMLLREQGFSTEDMQVILLVGNHSANGHALLDGGSPVAWFAIECFESELEAKIFTMHELIHALHYAARPEFAFENTEQKQNLSRQLITEGIATYLTKRLWNVTDETALWANKLPAEQRDSWMAACKHSEKELFKFAAARFESSDPSIELFYSANPDDIYSYRAGYYIGLKLIESIASKNDFSYRNLLSVPMDEMKRLIWNELQSLCAK